VPIRLIAIDIDGTLLDSRGHIPAENRRAIAAALDRGIAVAIVTGRAFSFARPVVERLELPVLLVSSNGAIVRRLDGTTLLRRLLPCAIAHDVLDRTRTHRAEAAVIFDRPLEAQLVSGGMDWTHPSRVAYYQRNRPIIAEAVPLEGCLTEDPIEVMFNGGVVRMRALVALLAERAGSRYTVSMTEYEARDFTMVDVLGHQVTKGTTLAEWARLSGISAEEVMAVGDNHNDREMLAYAGVGVAMGNSVPELLDGTFRVTRTHDEAGLAVAIDRFALAQP
jgi:hypothetical protein